MVAGYRSGGLSRCVHFDFELDHDDMATIAKVDTEERLGADPKKIVMR